MDDEFYGAGLSPLRGASPSVTPLPAPPARLKPARVTAPPKASPYAKYMPDYTGMYKKVRPVPGYGVMLPEVTVTARTRNRNADGSPMTRADIRRAEDYAARTGYGLNGARDFSGRVMSPEEQLVTHQTRTRPDYEGLNSLIQFGLGFTPGWAARIDGPVGLIDDAVRYGYKGFCKLGDWIQRRSYHYPPRAYYGEDYPVEYYLQSELGKALARNNQLGFTF